MKCIRDKLFLA